jgi:hypothetical protein
MNKKAKRTSKTAPTTSKSDDASWAPILKRLDELHSPELAVEPSMFKQDIWDEFNPKRALALLMDDRKPIQGLREAAFAALCAWVLAPEIRIIRRNAVRVAILAHMAKAEQRHRKAYSKFAKGVDAVVRLIDLGPYFLSNIYYAMGGISALSKTTAMVNHQKIASARFGEAALTLINTMEIFHFITVCLTRRKAPGLKGAVELLQPSDVKSRPQRSLRMVQTYWKNRGCAVALLYAARDVYPWGADDKSLFAAIMGGGFDRLPSASAIREWVAKAHYVCNQVLARTYEPSIAERNREHLPAASEQALSRPILTPDHETRIKEAYRVI